MKTPAIDNRPCGACGTLSGDMLKGDFCCECSRLELAKEVRNLKKRIADLEYTLEFYKAEPCPPN